MDEIDEIHADLAYWDAMTFAETVYGMTDRSSSYAPGALDFPAGWLTSRNASWLCAWRPSNVNPTRSTIISITWRHLRLSIVG